jgi:hypothetical protein
MRLALATALCGIGIASGAARAGPEATHTGTYKTSRFEVRYRPGSRAGAAVERTGAAAERDLSRIEKALEVKESGPFSLFLYDDLDELLAITKTEGNAGFSAGTASHLPYDDDQTRLHEMVHLVAAKWAKSGPEPRNFFPVEGIANAVLEHVHGVPVHAVAVYYRKRGRLPPLAEMLGAPDFYAWLRAHPGFDGYDVGGSWMRWLLDVHGAAKTKRWYTGTPAKQAFGADVSALEKGWHDALEKFVLRPEVETLLAQRHGEKASFTAYEGGLPAALLGKAEDWKTFTAEDARPRDATKWTCAGRSFAGTNGEGTWTVLDLGTEPYGDCVVRATIKTPSPIPVQVRLGDENQVMIVNGTFIYRGEQPVASVGSPAMDASRTTTDVVLVRRGPTLDVWVDGVKALTGPASGATALPGIGLHRGAATFMDVKVRRLP